MRWQDEGKGDSKWKMFTLFGHFGYCWSAYTQILLSFPKRPYFWKGNEWASPFGTLIISQTTKRAFVVLCCWKRVVISTNKTRALSEVMSLTWRRHMLIILILLSSSVQTIKGYFIMYFLVIKGGESPWRELRTPHSMTSLSKLTLTERKGTVKDHKLTLPNYQTLTKCYVSTKN